MDKLELLAEQYKNCCSENDTLRNDFEQSECARKTAIESLRIYKDETEERGHEIIALKAENARYREALEMAYSRSHEINCDWLNPNDDKCNCILNVINKALKGE